MTRGPVASLVLRFALHASIVPDDDETTIPAMFDVSVEPHGAVTVR